MQVKEGAHSSRGGGSVGRRTPSFPHDSLPNRLASFQPAPTRQHPALQSLDACLWVSIRGGTAWLRLGHQDFPCFTCQQSGCSLILQPPKKRYSAAPGHQMELTLTHDHFASVARRKITRRVEAVASVHCEIQGEIKTGPSLARKGNGGSLFFKSVTHPARKRVVVENFPPARQVRFYLMWFTSHLVAGDFPGSPCDVNFGSPRLLILRAIRPIVGAKG